MRNRQDRFRMFSNYIGKLKALKKWTSVKCKELVLRSKISRIHPDPQIKYVFRVTFTHHYFPSTELFGLRGRSHLTTTMWTFCVVRNGLHDYQCNCSHLTTKIKWSIVFVVNGIHFYRLKSCRQVRMDPYVLLTVASQVEELHFLWW